MSSPYPNNLPGDQATIHANRYGQFTTWQREQLPPPSVVVSLIGLVVEGVVVVSIDLFFLVASLLGWLSAGLSLLSLIFLGLFLLFSLMALPMLRASLRNLLRKIHLRRDLTEGLIAQEDGQVVFEGSGYMARASGRPLRDIYDNKAVNLAPGAYRFYYLPHSRRIISAEQHMLFEPGGPKTGVLLALAQAHGFSLDELNTNRQGRTSARQRLGLVRGLLFLFVIFGVLGIGAIWQINLLLRTSPWGFLVLGGVLLLLTFLTYHRWLDLVEGRVAMLEGYVERIEHGDEGGPTYVYVLGKQEFPVNTAGFNALVPGERYRLYLLPHSKQLVSIEPLP